MTATCTRTTPLSPFLERDGIGGTVLSAGEKLAELGPGAEPGGRGLNKHSTDPLHAYEEGINHDALMAYQHYGDPVYLERCMVNAKSTEALTVLTPAGHRHFKSQDCGSVDLRMDRRTDIDGGMHVLMWHSDAGIGRLQPKPEGHADAEGVRRWVARASEAGALRHARGGGIGEGHGGIAGAVLRRVGNAGERLHVPCRPYRRPQVHLADAGST